MAVWNGNTQAAGSMQRQIWHVLFLADYCIGWNQLVQFLHMYSIRYEYL